jgi:hypothetical protein
MPVQGATYDIITNQTGTFPAPSSTCTCGIDVNESSSGFTYNGTAGVFSYVIKGTVGVQIFSATPVFDASTTNYFEETLTGNVTSSTLVNTSAGQHLVFHLCQDATGSRTVSYPTNLLGATTVGSTASKCTTQEFVVNSANTNAYAIAAGTTNQ